MRPKNFDEVLGLEPQIAALRSILAEGKKPKPFLLIGKFGCGKTTLAHIIAREVQGWDFTGSPQVIERNAANMRGIDATRELADASGTYPMVGKYQVIILDEAQQLTKEAQQVLLKVFETNDSPTVWIIATTNPEKINEGLRDRCQALPPLTGMTDELRRKLVVRAAEFTKFTADLEPFLAALRKRDVQSPRKILKAFEGLTNGLEPNVAISAGGVETTPEYFDIAFAVVFGQWDKDSSMFGGTKQVRAVGAMLKELDDKLKNKKAATDDTEEEEDTADEDDTQSKADVAAGLRAVVAGFLKGQVLPTIQKNKTFKFKEEAKASRAYKAMHVLANTVPAGAFAIDWAGLIVTLFRVNQIMQGKQ
jgi:hypothetical protein